MKSWFIGYVNIKFSSKRGRMYLDGWDDKLPILGFESGKSQNNFNIVINFKKVVWMHTHKQEDDKLTEETPEVEIKQWVPRGVLKLQVTKRTGLRFLKGYIGKTPVLGWEDKKIKNRFHLVVDFDRLNFLRNKYPNGADKAETEPIVKP